MTKQASAYALSDSLGYWVNRLAMAMRVHFERELAPFGVTAKQWAVLVTCYRGQARTPVELADALGIDRSAVTRLLDRLEAKRLLRRLPSAGDRRSVGIQLTSAGRKLVPKLIPISQEGNKRFWKAIPAGDRSRFLRILQDMVEASGT